MRKLKKPLSLLLAVMMLAGVFTALPFTANAATEGVWSINDAGAITYCSDWSSSELVVPKTVAGITVKSVNSGAIEECYFTKITFLGHIETISSEAITYCEYMEEMVFEEGVDEFKANAILGTSSDGFKLTIKESTNTVFNGSVLSSWADPGDITIAALDSNTGAKNFQTTNGYKWETVVSGHTHTWAIDTLTCTAEDKDTVTANLVCADDSSHTTSVTINKDDDEFTVVSFNPETDDATCTTTGTMVVNTNFTYDSQTIAENNKTVTISAYVQHDYANQKWTWWDNSLISSSDPEDSSTTENPLAISCCHCTDGDYRSFEFGPDYLRTVDDNGFTRGYIKTTHQFFSFFINTFELRGNVHPKNSYEYYTDTAPHWEWADNYSSATATFDDGEEMTDSVIYSEQIIDTLDGNKEKTRYVATIKYRGNVYHSARKVLTPTTHTITWKNDDGSVIDTTTVADGAVPSHADPTKASSAEYDYTFAGWTPAVVAATDDAEYTATYTSQKRSYTITWLDDDNSVIDTTTVEYGETPTHAEPAKTSSAEYDYTFAGWTPEVEAVTGEATYKASYTPVKRSYTITWTDDEDNVIDTTTVEYGETPTHADASKPADGCTAYNFDKWTPDIVPVTGEATYKASFTTSQEHTYGNPVWYWTETEASYTAALKLTCSGCGDKVTLSGDDIDYDFNPFCTSYDGEETTYHVSAEYNGVTYEETKTVPSIDPENIIGSIALDNIMTTAADAKAQDDNRFGLSDNVYYRNLTVLGVQKKEAITTTDGQSTGTDLRFVAVAKSELLENAQDYGFMVATSAQSVWNTDKQIGALTAEAFPNSKYTCKDTDNTICGDYGLCSTDTDYKYVTLAVNGVDEDETIAARFYIKDSNGVYHYAKYTNGYCKTYQGIAVKYSDLG